MRPATPEIAAQLLRTDLDHAIMAGMENGLTLEDVEKALQHQLKLNAEMTAEAYAEPAVPGA